MIKEDAIFVPPEPLNTAVLFLIFNRPSTTQQVFDIIRKARPPRLYIASDGARKDKAGETEKVLEVRAIVKNVDWDCEVKTLFRNDNLGCGLGVSSAVTWFFENENQGVVLEDDCMVSISFFWFCEELLEKYKDDKRVMQISAFNPLEEVDIEESYYFSKYGPIWGWASWKRAWDCYDFDMSIWPKIRNRDYYKNYCDSSLEEKWRFRLFEDMYKKKIDTWDYQWSFAKLINTGLSIVGRKNMVTNIGFDSDATHTIKGGFSTKCHNIEYPLKHQDNVLVFREYDKLYLRNFAGVSGNLNKILSKVRRLFNLCISKGIALVK